MAEEDACPYCGSHRVERDDGETFPSVFSFHCFNCGRDFKVDLDTGDPVEQEAQDDQEEQNGE